MSIIDLDVEEAKIIQKGYLKIWQVFMYWFTWFFGADLLAMSWVVTARNFHGWPGSVLAAVWIVCAILGIVVCILMGIYTKRTSERFEALAERSRPLANREVSLMLGNIVTSYAWIASALALVLTIPAWIILLVTFWP